MMLPMHFAARLSGFSMVDAGAQPRPKEERFIRRLLLCALYADVGLHLVQLVVPQVHSIQVSRLFTAAVPLLAAFCGSWRASRLPAGERPPWRWLSVALVLLTAGQVVETLVGHSTAAVNLSVDASDFLYITAALPLLLAVSRTRHTEAIRSVFYLEVAQVLLASVLAFVLLYRMSLPAEKAVTAMGRIFTAECVLLAVFAVLRIATWSTLEERRRVWLLFTVVWIYLPVEVGMEFAATHWNLHAGTWPDIFWSVPFLFAGHRVLYLRIDGDEVTPRKRMGRTNLLLESLFPVLITAGVFVLAASVASQHLLLALSSIFLLLVIQSLNASLVQVSYLHIHELLLNREFELEKANKALERLSLEDPLTGIPNRRRFDSALQDAWRRALRRRSSITVLMIDVDFFKAVNDQHGHTYGDECLIQISHVLGEQVGRPDDLRARYGGEEFVVLLPETTEQGAITVADRIREAIYELGIVNEVSAFDHRLTVSVGIGTCVPQPGKTPDALIEAADGALYEAKRQGRNKTCVRKL